MQPQKERPPSVGAALGGLRPANIDEIRFIDEWVWLWHGSCFHSCRMDGTPAHVVPGPRAAGRSTPRLGLALLAAACAGIAFAGIARAGGPTLGACTLLTAGDVERVQGGRLAEAISSGNAAEAVATT